MQRMSLVGFYITAKHAKYGKSNFRMTPAEVVREDWEGWTIENMRPSTFKFAEIISDESARNLFLAVK